METKKIENGIASLYVDESGVLISRVKKDKCTLRELDENFIHMKTITNGRHVCGMLDGVQLHNLDRWDVAYMEREYPRIYKALAITTNSIWARIRAAFAIRRLQSKIPVRVFASSASARNWLNDFL